MHSSDLGYFAALAFLALVVPSCSPADRPGPSPAPSPSQPRPVETVAPDAPDAPRPPDAPVEAPAIRFRDISATSGVTFTHHSGMRPARHFPTNFGSGLAALDYDGDGLLDLYCATTRNLPPDAPDLSGGNRLYRNQGDGTFVDVTEWAGVGYRGFCHGAVAGDVNGDGFPDLFLTNLGRNVLYLNNGDGTFLDATAGSGLDGPPWSTGAAFLDYDGDGLLDLYVSCYGEWDLATEKPCGDAARKVWIFCSPFTITPARHYLYRNRGDGSFEETTRAAGVFRHDGRGLGVLAADLNGDGLTDLYVANDGCPNFLFLNRGDGTFDDASERSGAATNEAGEVQGSMGVDAEDVNEDGLPELLVTNFRAQYTTLYQNHGGANFQDISASAGIIADSAPWVGWGCALGDFDNDALPDIIVFNGEVDDNLKELGVDVPFEQPPIVWRNLGGARFRRARDVGPFFAGNHVVRGATFFDIDNDGRLDAVASLYDGHPAVLMNDSEPRSWVRVELLGRVSNRSAIGATVILYTGDRAIHRLVKGGGSFLSSNDPRALFGLGAADHVDRIEVRWPGGARSTLDAPALGQTHQVREPAAAPGAGARP